MQSMPEGGQLEIRSYPESTEKSVVVEVRDTGEAIQGKLERIFDPFFTTRPEGTGLGLAVSHQLVESHAGSISALRNIDRGITIRIELPIEQHSGGAAHAAPAQ
jgi:signal transduction histidine kinase